MNSIQLSNKLKERMELAVSQYILQVKETEREEENPLHPYDGNYSDIEDVIDSIFDCSYNHYQLPFQDVAKDYFTEKDYEELKTYRDQYQVIIAKLMPEELIYLEDGFDDVVQQSAFCFASLNNDFITNQLEYVNTHHSLLK